MMQSSLTFGVFMCLTTIACSRNVLFLFEDDGGFALGAYGDTNGATPNIDALATSKGTTFDAAYTSVSSCSPSRASLLTGIATHENGMYGLCQPVQHFSASAGVQSIPNFLNTAGVATGISGKYHVWATGSEANGAASFNFSWGNKVDGPGGCLTGASIACSDTDYNEVSRNITAMRDSFRGFHAWAASRPWFYYVGFGDSHRCGGAVGEFCELYGIDAKGHSTIPDWVPKTWNPATVSLPWWIQDTPIARQDFANMLTAKNRMDQGVGLFLDVLEKSGDANETLVIYTADNGAPWASGKTTFYEPGAGEPMVISVPGGAGGARTSVLASLLDVMPTILDWMGVPFVPYSLNGNTVQLRGKSLLPFVTMENSVGGDATEKNVPTTAVHDQVMTAAAWKIVRQSGQHRSVPTPLPANYSAVRGSFQSHEVQMYFPMRLLIVSDPLPLPVTSDAGTAAAAASPPTFKYKLLYNIAGALDWPVASDLWGSPSFQDLVNRTAAGLPTHWFRNFSAYLGPRPRYELYDLLADPTESTNQAANPAYADIFTTLAADMKAWQIATSDDWVIKYSHQ